VARNSKAPDFEQALAELETLVERLERGDLPLDEAL
jgi:exodeoxyribonuclease VII small subunit